MQVGRDVAVAIVETERVPVRTEIGQAVFESGLAVTAHAEADREEVLYRDSLGGEVDHTAAKFTRIVGRVGLLDQRRCNDIGREDVERNNAAKRFGARQGEAVEECKRVAITQTANKDAAIAYKRQTSDTAKRASNVAFARTGDVGF